MIQITLRDGYRHDISGLWMGSGPSVWDTSKKNNDPYEPLGGKMLFTEKKIVAPVRSIRYISNEDVFYQIRKELEEENMEVKK